MTVPEEGANECRRLAENALWAGQTQLSSAGLWNIVHYALLLPAAVLGALATVLALSRGLEGWAALAAGLASVLTAAALFLDPASKHRIAHASGEDYMSLRTRARQAANIRIRSDTPRAEVAAICSELEQDYSAISGRAPFTGHLAYWFAKRNIEQGRVTNEVDVKPET